MTKQQSSLISAEIHVCQFSNNLLYLHLLVCLRYQLEFPTNVWIFLKIHYTDSALPLVHSVRLVTWHGRGWPVCVSLVNPAVIHVGLWASEPHAAPQMPLEHKRPVLKRLPAGAGQGVCWRRETQLDENVWCLLWPKKRTLEWSTNNCFVYLPAIWGRHEWSGVTGGWSRVRNVQRIHCPVRMLWYSRV